MPELYQLSVDDREGIALVRLAGEIDLSNADEFAAELNERISNRVLAVIVDMSELRYIDSYGLTVLFDLTRRLELRQQQLRIVLPEGAHLRRVFETVGFDRMAALDASVVEARAEVVAPQGESG